jgi:hypothetical protein
MGNGGTRPKPQKLLNKFYKKECQEKSSATIYLAHVVFSGTMAKFLMFSAIPFHASQITGSAVLVFTGVLFHVLNDRPIDIETLISELKHPTSSGKEFNQTAFFTFVCLAVGALIAAITFAVTGVYKFAAIGYIATWMLATVAVWIRCSVFAKVVRLIWTMIAAVMIGVVCVLLYFLTCPTLKISPSTAKFSAVGELYTFRVENKSDSDTYMNSFLFYLESSSYSTADFDFQVLKDSRKPLGQQPDGVTLEVPDVFGEFGSLPESSSTHVFLLYVYHLRPHEFREVSIRLKQYEISTNQSIPVSSEVMSYTENIVPVSRDGVSVYVPALITKSFDLTGFLVCYATGADRACRIFPAEKTVRLPEGCMSLAAISEKEKIPDKILPGKCEP